MTTFYLIRHGETEWNRLKKYTGQADIPLTEKGKIQAEQAQQELQGLSLDAAYSSDLQRARHTAERALGGHPQLTIELDERLREIDQGEWEGLHIDEIKSRYADEFKKRKANPVETAPPGGESVGQVQERVIAAMKDIHMQTGMDKNILISSHGLAIAVARVYFGGFPIETVWDYIPNNAEITAIEVSQNHF